jgi:nascent polypeptide-associated complex subunit beta
MNTDPKVLAARRRLASKFGKNTRTGGKGSVRRKKKSHKTSSADEKRLQSTLKRLRVNKIPGIEEANLFKEDGNVIHFQNPTVQASIPANTFVISGRGETKSLQELLPGVINQLGPDNLANLKKLAESLQGNENAAVSGDGNDSDDDIPELVENFDEATE